MYIRNCSRSTIVVLLRPLVYTTPLFITITVSSYIVPHAWELGYSYSCIHIAQWKCTCISRAILRSIYPSPTPTPRSVWWVGLPNLLCRESGVVGWGLWEWSGGAPQRREAVQIERGWSRLRDQLHQLCRGEYFRCTGFPPLLTVDVL